jgi:hypothetical protein
MEKRLDLSSAALHVLAMALMLMDHMWATVLPGQSWLTWAGRVAFPIFAFMAVEGYFRTGSFKKYMLRLLIFAVISEVPFNLLYNDSAIYPFHQNVLWTFMIGLLCIRLMEFVRKKGKMWLYILTCVLATAAGYLLGTVLMVDYYGAGVLTVLTFYFFRDRKWYSLIGQIAALIYINIYMLKGLYVPVTVLGREVDIYQQSLALLALIPIWLYKGRQGHHSRPFQYACYAFYPAHMLALAMIERFM